MELWIDGIKQLRIANCNTRHPVALESAICIPKSYLLQHSKHSKEDIMKALFKGLDTETQLLVALGSAVACGCIPCLESITGLARAEGIDKKKMRAAAIIGQFVKDQPANSMKAAADSLLGTNLQSAAAQAGCPMESEATMAAADQPTMRRARYGTKLNSNTPVLNSAIPP